MPKDLDPSPLAARRERVARAPGTHGCEIFLVGAGEPLPLPEGTDQTYPFRAHSEYVYLAGLDSPRRRGRVRSEARAAQGLDELRSRT